MWNLPAPPGFEGLRDDLPLCVYDQVLPHWRQVGATYFVTFRLGDSLPQAKVRELRARRDEWNRRHPPPRSRQQLEEVTRQLFTLIEHWLDQGYGNCLLKDPTSAAHVVGQLHDSDNINYELGCYVVMPNHVHAIVRPLQPRDRPLEDILRLWKGASARAINQYRNTSGSVWQRDSYDRIIRDVEHLYRVIQYIGRNPRRSNIDSGSAPLWIRPSWRESGWEFEPA
jgi:hypothetical protein